jgi:hypothetical protein
MKIATWVLLICFMKGSQPMRAVIFSRLSKMRLSLAAAASNLYSKN